LESNTEVKATVLEANKVSGMQQEEEKTSVENAGADSQEDEPVADEGEEAPTEQGASGFPFPQLLSTGVGAAPIAKDVSADIIPGVH
jgi:hypothetical protein